MTLHLGKLPHKPDARDWKYADFRSALGAIPAIPTIFGHGNTYQDWKMLANGPDPTAPGAAAQGCGDCVWASADHETMEALTDAGHAPSAVEALFDGSTAVADYSQFTGYNPRTGEGDNGTEIREALNQRKATGIIDKARLRHKIGAYVSVEKGNLEHLLEALYFFEGLPIGIELQQAQMEAFNTAEANGTTPVWDYKPGSEVIGGHCIPLVGRPNTSVFAGISWAKRLIVTPALLSHLCDEIWAYVSLDRVNSTTGKSYEHVTPAALEEYLHIVGK